MSVYLPSKLINRTTEAYSYGKDIRGKGLALANRFAGSQFAEKHGLRKPAERFAYSHQSRLSSCGQIYG